MKITIQFETTQVFFGRCTDWQTILTLIEEISDFPLIVYRLTTDEYLLSLTSMKLVSLRVVIAGIIPHLRT